MNANDLLFKDFPPANVIGGDGGRGNNSDNINQQQQQQQQQQYNNSMRSGSGGGGNPSNIAELKLYSPNHRNINPFANPSIQSGLPASSTGYNQQSSSVLSGDPLDNLINDMQTSIDIINSPSSSSSAMEQNASQSQQNEQQQQQQQSQDKTNSIGYSFFTIEYYQQYFNVDTEMVLERIRSAVIPRRASITYLEKQIGTNPDLYGPFWIVMTLIFSIAISGNLSNYLQRAENDYRWQYNFHLVSYAATTIFLYVCFVPLGLWGAFKWFVKQTDQESDSSTYTPSLLTLICIYGYSMVIYIPVSILWVIQISFLQWILVISAAFLSGSVLIIILTPALRVSKISLIIAIGIVAAHFLMAASFMLYFFHVPNYHDEIAHDNVIVKQTIAETVVKEAIIVKNLTAT